MYQAMAWNYEEYPGRFLYGWPWEICSVNLEKGIRLKDGDIPNPLEIITNPISKFVQEMGPAIPDVFDPNGLVLSDRLYRTVVDFGVDNLDAYPVVLHDEKTTERFTGFWAINVIGLIAAADLEKSSAIVQPGGPVIDVAFDNLVIDEAKARGALMFRLVENTGNVWLHESLIAHIKKSGFPGIEFFKSSQVF